MKPTLRQLEYLVAIAETGRFSEAARRMNVSQPSLSAQVADAEDHLGVTVFERGRAGAILTPVGADIIRHARDVLHRMDDLKSVAKHGEGRLYGRIRLGVLPTIGPYLLPLCSKDLHTRFPDLRLVIRDEAPIDLAQGLEEGRLDAVISTWEEHPGYQGVRLFQESLSIAIAPDDPLADQEGPVDLGDLAGRAFLTLGLGHRLTLLVQRLAEQAGAYISTDYQGTSLDAIRHMAALGGGVAVLPELYLTTEAARDDSLAFRRINHPEARRDIALIWRETSPVALRLPELADQLSKAAKHILDGAF
ncbi:LysR substrate-binding domain-containing protein [Maricaulis sp. D1M11]|uniref:LysR substrate-binding domain-containing protein n=1 Tax=Maricaulis sp. D1M11 TaxID=3076117 RepID=UPI0039B50B1F